MTLASFLNFNRSISPSEGLLFGLVTKDGKEHEIPVLLSEKTVRGAISNFIDEKKYNPENPKKELDPASPNIQKIDAAFLPYEAERIVLRFSLVIHGGSVSPSGCDKQDVRAALERIVAKAAEKGAYRSLGERYAWNLVNGRTLWRNRLARNRRVEITLDDDETLSFQSDNVDTFRYGGLDAMPVDFDKLAARIGEALTSKEKALFVRVRITGELPPGAEVFPSQEFAEEDKSRGKKQGEKRRLLSSRTTFLPDGRTARHATLHSQKLGNAIRTIDDWHPQAGEMGAIAVETYGYSQGALKTLRLAKRLPMDGVQGKDFYTLLKDLPALEKRVNEAKAGALPDDVLYFMAVLVRGGVFSGGKRESNGGGND